MAKELALIGCGNMGGAMVRGIVSSGLINPQDIVVTSATERTQQAFAAELGCEGTCDNRAAAKGARIVLLAVKPQVLSQVASDLAPALDDDAIVISVAAGFTLDRLGELVGAEHKIVRAMPNLPATVREAMTSVTPNAHVTEDELAYVVRLFESFGRGEVVPERMIDAVVAAAGSSPAYVCMFIEALADAAVAEGMPRAQAYVFAEQAVLGTAKYLLETGAHPAVLKDMVCSPGGTTIEAVAALEAGGLRSTVIEAARATAAKNRAM